MGCLFLLQMFSGLNSFVYFQPLISVSYQVAVIFLSPVGLCCFPLSPPSVCFSSHTTYTHTHTLFCCFQCFECLKIRKMPKMGQNSGLNLKPSDSLMSETSKSHCTYRLACLLTGQWPCFICFSVFPVLEMSFLIKDDFRLRCYCKNIIFIQLHLNFEAELIIEAYPRKYN